MSGLISGLVASPLLLLLFGILFLFVLFLREFSLFAFSALGPSDNLLPFDDDALLDLDPIFESFDSNHKSLENKNYFLNIEF